MSNGFIPPPFPFPEAWPRIFDEQQRQQSSKWLTPSSLAPVTCQTSTPWCPMGGVSDVSVTSSPSKVTVREDVEREESEEDGDYEYGFVLSDEWRTRFRGSQQQPKRSAKNKARKAQKKTKQGQAANARALGALAVAASSRSEHLQREVRAAKTRELARKWKRRGSAAAAAVAPSMEHVEEQRQLEASLNMLFDEFCDVFQPVVKPRAGRSKMNLGQMKNDPANGSSQAIPSLKRTLSGGAAGNVGHNHGHGSLGSHLGVGMNAMNSIPSVLHATPNTNPPQMLRAVTSSGVYNRPSASSFRGGSGGGGGLSAMGSSGTAVSGNVSAMGATTATRSVSQSSSMQDWRMYLTIEERQAVRSKIRDAYTSRCSTYEDLLQVVRRLKREEEANCWTID
ncbi:hypothetical protein BBJ28_00012842 [Nothophytophthora sp. Chile5]|nr:hypothetical protein BBJ28_00012842 [Nothophytophthora sp. Chile5]